jgi:hypothetical protein
LFKIKTIFLSDVNCSISICLFFLSSKLFLLFFFNLNMRVYVLVFFCDLDFFCYLFFLFFFLTATGFNLEASSLTWLPKRGSTSWIIWSWCVMNNSFFFGEFGEYRMISWIRGQGGSALMWITEEGKRKEGHGGIHVIGERLTLLYCSCLQHTKH